jgi:ferrochelatase
MTKPKTAPKTAIVLFNLGGPDSPDAIAPFLRNLFNDPAIIRVPPFIRPFLARTIARAREAPARENYALLGGRSPLLELTEAQARALESALPELDARCFVAMRYWHPFSAAAAAAIRAWNPDRLVLLPLYPQFSTTTTGSSLADWREAAVRAGLALPVSAICCYHDDPGFIAATAAILRRHHDEARAALDPAVGLRLLFSAHGLPEPIIRAGDPYQFQVERTVAALRAAAGLAAADSVICYQSRATPQRWIGPSTDAEVERAGADGVAVLVVPVAFVSEHSETLVELDVEYRHLAGKHGVKGYFRVPTQGTDPDFIAALAALVRRALARGSGLCRAATPCPAAHRDCPHRRAGRDPESRAA